MIGKDQEVRGQGKLEIIFIGSGAGGGTGLKFGESCLIVRKESLTQGEMTNILVNYGTPSEDFDIIVGLANSPTIVITPNDINAILPTSLAANHIDKLPSFVLSRNNPIDLIVPSDNFKEEFWNLIKDFDPANPLPNAFETYFNKILITQVEDFYDDIGINYFVGNANNTFEVMFDERINYSGTILDEIEFYQGKHQV